MASIHRRPGSKYWHAAYTRPDGKRALRSTKQTDKKRALLVAFKFEDAANRAKGGTLSAQQARAVIAQIFEVANDTPFPEMTVRKYLEQWLVSKALDVSQSSIREYKTIVRRFLEAIGSKADMHVDMFNVQDAKEFKLSLSNRITAKTANKYLKTLRSIWNSAEKESITRENPFTCVDLFKNELRFTTQKTSQHMVMSLLKPLQDYLALIPVTDDMDAYIFPELQDTYQRNGERSGTLSRQFTDILKDCGIRSGSKSHKKNANGRDGKRVRSQLSFHSLRHSTTTLLKQAGVSDAIARAVIGHESEAVSRQYTHLDSDTIKKAMSNLKDLTETGKI